MWYTTAFVFNIPLTEFVIIQKPLHGSLLNVPGGKILQNGNLIETPHGAVSREFQEEAGVLIPPDKWSCFHISNWQHTKHKVYHMFTLYAAMHKIKTNSDEGEIQIHDYYDLYWDPHRYVRDIGYLTQIIKTHVKVGDIFCINPENVNKHKSNKEGWTTKI